MKIKNIFQLLLVAIVASTVLTSCLEEELAFDVVESPVLAIFDEMSAEEGMIKVKATFYELDKSNILDYEIGIDSTEISGLPISVFIEESNLVQELMTDSEGAVIFESSLDALSGNSRLEWVGNYSDTNFRIYYNF